MAGLNLQEFIPNINLGSLLDTVLTILLIVIIIGVFGGLAFFFMKKKKDKKEPLKTICWWEEVQKKLVPTTQDSAKEIIIPGTRLRVFYIKSKDMWLPRFTRGITKDLFYVVITPKRELVNFTLTSIGDDMEKAGLEYDHTDMIWASENLREFIQRNYRDKSTPWWKEYQGVITTAIYIVIMTVSFIVILYFMRLVVKDMGGLIGQIGTLMREAESCSPRGSGIAPAFIPFMFAKFKRRIKFKWLGK